MNSKIKGYHSDIIEYFPDNLSPKRFMWDIFSTLTPSWLKVHITFTKWNLEEFEWGRTVEVSEDFLNQLHAAHYFSRRKEKTY